MILLCRMIAITSLPMSGATENCMTCVGQRCGICRMMSIVGVRATFWADCHWFIDLTVIHVIMIVTSMSRAQVQLLR